MQQDNKKLERKVRRSYFISTISVALVLFLLGSVSYLIMNAFKASDAIRESITVFVMLDDGLSDDQTQEINAKLASHVDVKQSVFVSKDQAAADFKTYIGSDFEEFLQHNPLPNSFEVSLKAASTQKEIVVQFEKELLAWQGVDELVYQKNVIDQISSNINKFNFVLLLFGGGLLIISLILLNNTIRMTILSKRYIISTMKLVGASNWFILRPFMGKAVLQGIYSALLSSLMFFGMIAGINEGLPELGFSSQQILMYYIMGGMLVLGVLISFLFTTFAVRKFVKMRSNNMYLY